MRPWGCALAERVVRVRLSATVDEYKKGMLEAAQATRTVGTEAEKLAQIRQSMNLLGTAGVAMGAAVVAGIGMAVAKFAEFDQAMSYVAATGEDAKDSIDGLRQAALDAGASTVFSATEAANAIEELAKAGLSAKDILGGGLNGALDLAAAGGLGVADAAGIAATTLKQFRLDGEDASHVADLLAAGAGKAMGDVSDLSQALSQGGLVANQFGLSVDETVGTLSSFASAGMLGSDAGTSFRTMLLRLANPTGEASEKMQELGINAYDAQGNFVGMAGLAGQLEDSMKGLSQEQRNAALAIIFGQDAIRGANVLLAEGADGIQEWTDKVNDQGYAAETAATRLDNLIGDWEQFTGALDTAMIAVGSAADGPLRSFVQMLTTAVEGFNALPDWAKNIGTGVAAAAGGIALVGGAALLAIPKVAELKVALDTLGVNSDIVLGKLSKLAKIGGGALIGFAAASVGLDMLTQAMQSMGDAAEVTDNKLASAANAAEVLNAGLGKGFGASDDIELAQEAVEHLAEMLDLAASGAQATGDSILGVVTAAESVDKLGAELGELAQTNLPAAQEKFRLLAEEAGLTDAQILTLLDKMQPFKSELTKQATASGEAADGQELLNLAMGEGGSVATSTADAYLEQVDAVEALNDELVKLIDRINEANGIGQDAVTANARWQAALEGLSKQVEQYGTSLDQNTASGSANAAALADLASAAQDAAAAQFEQDQRTMSADEATQKYLGTLSAQRQAFIDAAIQAGYSAEQVQALADKVFALPSEKEVAIIAQTAESESRLSRFQQAINNLTGKTVEVTTKMTTVNGKSVVDFSNANGGYYSGGVKAFASGGFEPGIYPYTPGGIHKFAEEADEAYISLDPARRARSESVWVKTGQEMGMFSGSGRPTQPPAVYVQNPFTGEYLLAQVASVADDRIGSYDDSLASTVRRGRRAV